MKERNNFFSDTDWFDIQFTGGFLDSNNKIKEFLNEPRYKVGDESISSRVLNHWHDKGILNDNRPKGSGWRKFSFTEVIWLGIVSKLRTFGLDLKKIYKVKQYFDAYVSKENQSQNPLLDFYIFYCMTSKMPVKLLVFDSGEALIGRQVSIDLSTQHNFIKEDYISIDIGQLMNKRFKGKRVETDYLDYSLSPVEKEIKKSIHFDQVNSLEINIGKGQWIHLTKEHIRYNQDEISNLLNKIGNYYEQSILVKGNRRNYKVIEKKKLKK